MRKNWWKNWEGKKVAKNMSNNMNYRLKSILCTDQKACQKMDYKNPCEQFVYTTWVRKPQILTQMESCVKNISYARHI